MHVEIILVRLSFLSPAWQLDGSRASIFILMRSCRHYVIASFPHLAYRSICDDRSASALWKHRPILDLPFALPALERTFLGYLRTALALSIISVIIAQLYRLEHPPNPDRMFGFFNLGIPLACVCIGAAIMVFFFGAYRFWRQQNAMLRGKVHAGGWEVNAIGLIIALVRKCPSCDSR